MVQIIPWHLTPRFPPSLHPWLPHGRTSPGETQRPSGFAGPGLGILAPHASCVPPPARLSAAPHHPLTLLPTLHAAMLLPTSGEILSHPFHHLSTTSTVLLNPSSAGLNTHGGARRVGKKEKEVV